MGSPTTLRVDTGNGNDSTSLESGRGQTGVEATDATITGGHGFDTLVGIDDLHVEPGGTQLIDEIESIA